jgi:hypothetical protein
VSDQHEWDYGLHTCSGCRRMFSGPTGEADCKRHVFWHSLLEGAFFFSLVAFVMTLFILHSLGRL